jgi:hypothetical protein
MVSAAASVCAAFGWPCWSAAALVEVHRQPEALGVLQVMFDYNKFCCCFCCCCCCSGVAPEKLKRTASLSSLDEIIMGRDSDQQQQCFVFMIKVCETQCWLLLHTVRRPCTLKSNACMHAWLLLFPYTVCNPVVCMFVEVKHAAEWVPFFLPLTDSHDCSPDDSCALQLLPGGGQLPAVRLLLVCA